MACNFYIYYKVDPAKQGEVEPLIYTLLSRVACRTGVHGRLLKKLDGSATWMEVYEGIADSNGFERVLQELCERYDIDIFIDRHTERFEEVHRSTAVCD